MAISAAPPTIESHGGKLLDAVHMEWLIDSSGHLLWIAPLVGTAIAAIWLVARRHSRVR